MNKTTTAVKLLALGSTLAAVLGAVPNAAAQARGDWTVKAGFNKITPKVESGNVSAPALPNTKADVGTDSKPILNLAYFITDNIAAELDMGAPYRHKLFGADAIAGTGQLGTVDVLPPTLFAQYRLFGPDAVFRPYVGLGITYAYFRRERGSAQLTAVLNTGGPAATFSLESKWAASAQLGASFRLNERWSLDGGVIKTRLRTTATYSTGQTQAMKLDPVAVNLGVTFKF
ncbi:OmpW/AlkL family protein [Pseudoduganella albidiflava]|uniref:OmpW family protein n=1 Tax=Pseudoduganella albidiflava TaxID=321983 RepID=A0A411WSG9_9BURK|nr:OmpW family outer membrane protein [Pseudoduganella albidiflava]QBH99597.1 OmpW family protein [Pseudoduganella albidiflava]GGY46071.1 outer membrane protein W [Pseudoduganella albidiflava]